MAAPEHRTTDAPPIAIRPLREEEMGAVRALGRRALPFALGLLMAATVARQGVVAAGPDGTLLGVVTLRTARIGRRQIGIIDWAAVDPRHQGRGIASRLGTAALDWFRERGCDEVVTTDVDGYNTPAWNFLRGHGLRSWPVAEQIRSFGWRWPQLMLAIPHIGVGTFILHRSLAREPAPERPQASNLAALLGAVAYLAAILLPLSRVRTVLWESRAPGDLLAPLDPGILLAGAGVVAVYAGLRVAAHWLASRARHLAPTFRPWDSGLILATLLAAAFGSFTPGFSGNLYASQPDYDYRRGRATIGAIALAGVATSLALLTLCTIWAERDPPPALATLGRSVGLALGITDAVLWFAPFQPTPAGLIWRWRPLVGAALCAWFLVVWLLLPRLF